MGESSFGDAGVVLAIDIGATNVKFCHVDRNGNLLEGPKRRPTPYPCSPARLIERGIVLASVFLVSFVTVTLFNPVIFRVPVALRRRRIPYSTNSGEDSVYSRRFATRPSATYAL
jgi:predicted NBD/HSP70 family sugar kinase